MSCSRYGRVLAAVVVLSGCAQSVQRDLKQPDAAATLDKRSPFLKVHLLDGRLYLLDAWQVDSVARTVSGQGRLFGPDRVVRDSGLYAVSLDSVALFETNVVAQSSNVNVLTALSVITGAVAIACIANPKACFGSCPTFYAATDDGEHLLAEGFSASVAPSLEATDIDALYPARASGRTLTLHMRNEAWETHVVRHVRVLAAPRIPGGRVFVTADGEYRQADALRAATRCLAAEGDCGPALAALDRRERMSTADSNDLTTREDIELEFAAPVADDVGVVIAYRQTLLTTYLFYQALAWMGDQAGTWLAAMGRSPLVRASGAGLFSALGKIEVLVPEGDAWVPAGVVGETGPLATDVKLVPLPRQPGGTVRVRLRMTRGLWRLDHVALARLGAHVTPERLRPARVTAARRDTAELRAWNADSTRQLATLPGDAVTFRFDLPADPERLEVFLEARGYYLEWMRQEWLAEAQPERAARLYLDPAGSLRELAPTFSRLEPDLERTFWSSRYARP